VDFLLFHEWLYDFRLWVLDGREVDALVVLEGIQLRLSDLYHGMDASMGVWDPFTDLTQVHVLALEAPVSGPCNGRHPAFEALDPFVKILLHLNLGLLVHELGKCGRGVGIDLFLNDLEDLHHELGLYDSCLVTLPARLPILVLGSPLTVEASDLAPLNHFLLQVKLLQSLFFLQLLLLLSGLFLSKLLQLGFLLEPLLLLLLLELLLLKNFLPDFFSLKSFSLSLLLFLYSLSLFFF